MYAIGDAAAILGVSTRTLRRWENAGKIKCIRTVGGHRRFPVQEIMRIMGSEGEIRKNKGNANADNKKSCAIYARVSGHKQSKRGDLDRQIESLKAYCKGAGYKIAKIYSDVGSGLNAKRKNLWRMIRDTRKGLFSVVLVNYKDRLTRFGYTYLKNYLKEFGVEVRCINVLEDKNIESELVEDLVAIIHSFSGRMYRLRRSKKQDNNVKD